MAFKKLDRESPSYSSPEALFLDLRPREVTQLWSHQVDILRSYMQEGFSEKNVALELPTGSGKTLIGLLIAEFRRRTRNEKVIYLCPTRQLVNQVTESCQKKYGIKTIAYVGSAKKYTPEQRSSYASNGAVFVTTYSSLFNINPFFSAVNTIILDDAHAAENYVAQLYTLEILRETNYILYTQLMAIFSDMISKNEIDRYKNDNFTSQDLPFVTLVPIHFNPDAFQEMKSLLDEAIVDGDLFFGWSMLKDHLHACNIYLSVTSVIIRPIIPPTERHAPFNNAGHRLFMSATLGRGGDLERITGVSRIKRIPLPPNWDRQGYGRRFFIFLDHAVKNEQLIPTVSEFCKAAGRALILVPSGARQIEVEKALKSSLPKFSFFTSKDLESNKGCFPAEKRAVAILAGRYDGIDFPDDECRLLFVFGVPKEVNLQEKFFSSTLGASILFNERISTRLIQAVGRCTRSSADYACVAISGSDFFEWFINDEKRNLLHPELQSEITFGLANSNLSINEILQNFKDFIAQSPAWQDADQEIVIERDKRTRNSIPSESKLDASSGSELAFSYAMWDQNIEKAIEVSEEVFTALEGDDRLKGYRAFWLYQRALALFILSDLTGDKTYRTSSVAFLAKAGKCGLAPSLMKRLSHLIPDLEPVELGEDDSEQMLNIEQIVTNLGLASVKRFASFESELRSGLESKDSNTFAAAHTNLGKLLGFESSMPAGHAAPDCIWMSTTHCIGFEDKQGLADGTPVSVQHLRETAGHRNWIESMQAKGDRTVSVLLVTSSTEVSEEAVPHAGDVNYFTIAELRQLADTALTALRSIRQKCAGGTDLVTRASCFETLRREHLDFESLTTNLLRRQVGELPKRRS